MPSRTPDDALRPSLQRHYRALRGVLVAREAARAAAWSAAILAATVALGAALPSGVGGSWLRLAGALALCVAGVAFAVGRFAAAAPGFDAYLERIEQRFPAVHSWLRNALDLEAHPPLHTSPALAAALRAETARRLAAVPLVELRPRLALGRPALVLAGALAAIVLLGVVAPARVTRSWVTLWSPAAAAPPIELAVEPGSVRISPGANLAVRARVRGTGSAPRLLRDGMASPAPAAEGGARDGERVWRFDLTQLTREQDYRVRVAGLESPRYHIALAGEPAPVSFEVEYRAPAYARLPLQRGAATRGDLTALRGTRARVTATFDRDLASVEATLPGGRIERWTALTPRRWQGEFTLAREGEYELRATTYPVAGAPGTARFRYRLTPLADAPPVLVVRAPAGDLDLPAGQQVPVEVLGQDDLGLSELWLQFRKDPAAAWTELPLARFPDHPREAHLATRWDASALALVPGESGSFRFVLFDDNAVSGRGRAVSPTFELRFPSLAELYDHLDARQGAVQGTLEKAAEQARELQKSLDQMARRQPEPATPTSVFERSEELRQAVQRQQELARQIDQAAEQLRQNLEQAAERQAFNEELTRKLGELHELMRQIQSEELREAIRRMQKALEALDRRALEQGLPQWRAQNRQTLENLQRTIDLLKQLRAEERLQSLARRAEELLRQQQELNQQHEAAASRGDRQPAEDAASRALAEQQARAADASDSLGTDVSRTGAETEAEAAKQDLAQAASELEQQAAPAQRQAAGAAASGQSSSAQRSGQQASQSLQRAASLLSQQASRMQQERDAVDLAAVRRAAQDLVSLQRASEDNLDSSAPDAERADRQADLAEGVARVADSLAALSRRTPFLSPKVAESLGRAMQQLSASGNDLGSGNRQRGQGTGRNAGEALTSAVLGLRAAEKGMCQNPGPGQGPNRSGRQMAMVGEQQARLNRESRTLAQRLTQETELSASDRDQLRRMAEEQRRIREALEQVEKDEEARRKLLGKLDEVKREMKEVEETLRRGPTDGSFEEKQQRILSRLLDAQRSVNRRDFDPERESRPGEDVARPSPGALPQELLRETDRLRLDLLKAEADRYPPQYRAFIEAYLRALNGSPR